jgi:translation elongation factor EF-1alpha
MAEREIKISMLGHKDHGKSTLLGRLLYETKSITEDRIKEAQNTSKSLGHEEFEYAFLLDSFEEEREGGFTLDTTRAQVHHEGVIYELIDVPGHKELVKNMITGASTANAAILIVSAKPEERLRDETKLHLYLASLLGIKNLVVAINKIDTIDYDAGEFYKITEEMKKILESFGYEKLSFVPVSAKRGDNIATLSDSTPWYTDKTILQFMDEFSKINYEKELDALPTRMFVQDVYALGADRILVGRVETGKFRKGQQVVVEPLGITSHIEDMRVKMNTIDEAKAGQNIGLMLKGEDIDKVERGNVCMPADASTEPVKSFTARIFCLPGSEIKEGEELSITCASQEGKATVATILEKLNPITDKEPKRGAMDIFGGESAWVKIELDKPLVFESFLLMPHTGRFVLSRNSIIAVGVVIS